MGNEIKNIITRGLFVLLEPVVPEAAHIVDELIEVILPAYAGKLMKF